MNLNITGVTGTAMRRPVKRKRVESQSSFGNFMVVLCKAVLLCGSIVGITYAYCAQNNEIVKVNQEIAQINQQCKSAERDVRHFRNLCNRRRNLTHLKERIAYFNLDLAPARYSQRNNLYLLSPEQVARSVYRAPGTASSAASTAYNRDEYSRNSRYSRY